MTFGVNCAPYLPIRTLSDVQYQFPLASEILRDFMYVDDTLAGAQDVKTAIKARDELIAALSSAGFSLKKWTSNSKSVFKNIPSEYRFS